MTISCAIWLGNVRIAVALLRAGAQPDPNWLSSTLLVNGPAFARALASAGLPFQIDARLLEEAMAAGPAALRLVLDSGPTRPSNWRRQTGGRGRRPLQRILADVSCPRRSELAALLIEAGAPAAGL
jgi:hypothetical protein